MNIEQLVGDERQRRRAFPAVERYIFLHHAGVCPLPAVAAQALRQYADLAEQGNPESNWSSRAVRQARRLGAQLLGARAEEIALLGPTSLGLSLVARGLDWQAGDRVLYHAEDYPANVYCWKDLARQGVQVVGMQPSEPGRLTWQTIEKYLDRRTRLVSLATASYLSGYRIDYAQIGRELHERGILFCLDAIQTLGAFPVDVEHVDFLAADSHKWLLGPMGAGLFYVKAEHHQRLRPALLGSWNVVSPHFIAQPDIAFYPGARRYEPGALNVVGIAAMAESLRLLLDVGIQTISRRILELRHHLLEQVRPLGYDLYLPDERVEPERRSGIVSLVHERLDLESVAGQLARAGVIACVRRDRQGRQILRFSPHFYNTTGELDRVAALLAEAGRSG